MRKPEMRLSEVGELALLEVIRKRFRGRRPGLVMGIGDDCAVVTPRRGDMLLTTDMMVEGVHFDLAWMTPYQLGFKLVSVNVSDICAMGGTPHFLLLNVAAPGGTGMTLINELFNGIQRAAKKYKISLIGGDISSSDKVVLSATVAGYSSEPVRRSGAKVGDLVYVTGCLGDSACGLRLLKKMKKKVAVEKGERIQSKLAWDIVLPLIRKHLMPSAVRPDRFARKATAMIDISDGLLIDLSRICKESRVGARIYADRVPLSKELLTAAEYLGIAPMDLALGGGEDYELLFTAPSKAKVGALCIGEVIKAGIEMVDRSGRSEKISIKGYQHFGH